MWEKKKYLRACPFQESPRRLVWLEHLGQMIAVVWGTIGLVIAAVTFRF